MDLLGQTSWVVSGISLTVGLSALLRNTRNRLYWAFFFLCLVIAAWEMSFAISRVYPQGPAYTVHLVIHVWLAPIGLAFIRILTQNRRLTNLAVILCSALAGAILSWAVLGKWSDSAPFLSPEIWKLAIAFSPVWIPVHLATLLWLERSSFYPMGPGPVIAGLGRRTMVYSGGILVLMATTLDHAPMLPKTFPVFGNIIMSAYMVFLVQSLTKNRIPNMVGLLGQFATFVLLATVLFVLNRAISIFDVGSDSALIFYSLLMSFVVLNLISPIQFWVDTVLERQLSRDFRGVQDKIQNASRELFRLEREGRVQPETLYEMTLSTTMQVLDPESASLFVLDSTGIRFHQVMDLRQGSQPETYKPKAQTELALESHLVTAAKKNGDRGELPVVLQAVLQSDAERSLSLIERTRLGRLSQTLKDLGGNAFFLLLFRKEPVGFIVVNSEKLAGMSSQTWGSSWGPMTYLIPFLEQVAGSLRNLEVLQKQKSRERLIHLGEMSAGLAHEIRNPLGAIKGAAELLEDGANVSEEQARFLRVIKDETHRLNRVVERFLSFARSDDGEVASGGASVGKVDWVSLTQKTIDFAKPGIPTHLDLRFTHPGVQKAWVMAHEDRLQQVMINLIQNAVRSVTQKNGPKPLGSDPGERPAEQVIDLEIRHRHDRASRRDYWIWSCSDRGQGMTPEVLEKIFVPFFTTHHQGTGLGLSISQKTIESLGGSIDVTSRPSEGAQFRVTLPCAEATEVINA
ncbi:MAG: HAMP domain-containing histidine kinase [Bdellovibrionales bacterium]|nr:HAMP domain-containing histidine kinase [Bdellovibrionales bacterium]